MLKSPLAKRIINTALPLLSIGLVGYMGTVLLHTSHANELTPTQIAAPRSSGVPASASSNCCTVSVNSVTRDQATPQRVTLRVTITNTAGSVLQISPGLQLTLQDALGTSHNYTAAYLPAGASVGGPLAPHASRTENLDFDVPANAAPATLTFQLDAASPPLTIGMPS